MFCSNNNTTKHHIIKQSFNGEDTYPNIIDLCKYCHNSLHNIAEANTRRLIRKQEPTKTTQIGNKELKLTAGSQIFNNGSSSLEFKTPVYGIDLFNPLNRSKEEFTGTMIGSSCSTVLAFSCSGSVDWVYYSIIHE